MGKNSLLKPTSKKKKGASTKEDSAATAKAKKTKAAIKKAAPKPKTTPKAKAAPKPKVAAKTKAASKPKVATKTKAASKAKKTTAVRAQKAVAPKKKMTLKDLIQKKFDPWKPEKRFSVSPDKAYLKNFVAPPFFERTTPKEEQRIKELLFRKFDVETIRAAGKEAAAQKAAAEKAAAEKAAAEKAAAEKVVAEKAAAEKVTEPEASITYGPPADLDTTMDDPMEKAMKYAAAVLVLLVALIIGASYMNSNNYYIEPANGAVEIRQGKFSPMGEELLIILPGVQPPETIKSVYSKQEVYPLIFNYYVEKADTLLEVSDLPDFEGIRYYLNKALPYATSNETKDIAIGRLDNIDLMILLYKSDVAVDKGTVSGLEDAKRYLSEASKLNVDAIKSDLIKQRIESIDNELAKMKSEAAEATAAKETESAPAPPEE